MTQYWKCFTSLFCLPNFLVGGNFLIRKLKGNMASQPKRVEEFGNIFFLQLLKSEGPLSNWSNLKRSNIFKNVIFPTSHRRANTRWKLISENMKCYTIFLSVQLSFLSDPSPIIELPCQPLSPSSCWILRKLLDLSKWIWQIDKWITPS